MDKLTNGRYEDNNGHVHSVDVWKKINNRSLFLCNSEWNTCGMPVASNMSLKEIWENDMPYRDFITFDDEGGMATSMKLFAKLKEDGADDPDLPFTSGGKKKNSKSVHNW